MPESTRAAHFFLEITLTFFLMAMDLFFLLIMTWKRSKSVRLARVVLWVSFFMKGVLVQASERPTFLVALMRVPVRAPRPHGTTVLVRDNLFMGRIVLGKFSPSTSTRFASAMSTIVTCLP